MLNDTPMIPQRLGSCSLAWSAWADESHSEGAAHVDLVESVDTAQSWGELRVPGPSLTTAVFRTQAAA